MGITKTARAEKPDKITYPKIFTEISESIKKYEDFFPPYDELVTKIRYRDEVNKLRNILLLAKDVNLNVEADGSLTNDDKNHLIRRLEIRGSAMLYGDDNPYVGFSLDLNFVGEKKNFSFMVAVTKGNGCDGHYAVWLEKENHQIRDGGSGYVKFFSKKDFNLAVKFCNDAIDLFNSELNERDKLIIYYK